MFGRSKLETNRRAPSSPRRSTISSRVTRSAVAVSAMRGTPGKRSCSSELHVFGTEVVAPLRHAVRLVDGEQRKPRRGLQALELLQEARHQQPLRRDVQKIVLAGEQAALDRTGLLGRQR